MQRLHGFIPVRSGQFGRLSRYPDSPGGAFQRGPYPMRSCHWPGRFTYHRHPCWLVSVDTRNHRGVFAHIPALQYRWSRHTPGSIRPRSCGISTRVDPAPVDPAPVDPAPVLREISGKSTRVDPGHVGESTRVGSRSASRRAGAIRLFCRTRLDVFHCRPRRATCRRPPGCSTRCFSCPD